MRLGGRARTFSPGSAARVYSSVLGPRLGTQGGEHTVYWGHVCKRWGVLGCRIREDSPYLLLGDEEGGGGPGHAGELETELGVVRVPLSPVTPFRCHHLTRPRWLE